MPKVKPSIRLFDKLKLVSWLRVLKFFKLNLFIRFSSMFSDFSLASLLNRFSCIWNKELSPILSSTKLAKLSKEPASILESWFLRTFKYFNWFKPLKWCTFINSILLKAKLRFNRLFSRPQNAHWSIWFILLFDKTNWVNVLVWLKTSEDKLVSRFKDRSIHVTLSIPLNQYSWISLIKL